MQKKTGQILLYAAILMGCFNMIVFPIDWAHPWDLPKNPIQLTCLCTDLFLLIAGTILKFSASESSHWWDDVHIMD